MCVIHLYNREDYHCIIVVGVSSLCMRIVCKCTMHVLCARIYAISGSTE